MEEENWKEAMIQEMEREWEAEQRRARTELVDESQENQEQLPEKWWTQEKYLVKKSLGLYTIYSSLLKGKRCLSGYLAEKTLAYLLPEAEMFRGKVVITHRGFDRNKY